MEILTKSPEGTKKLGKKIAANLAGGEIFALSGDLGSGKTTFIQGFAKALGINQRVLSPTFIILRKYVIKPQDRKNLNVTKLYHLDLYRLEGAIESQIKELGLFDFWEEDDAVTIIEWADKATGIYPKRTVDISFEYLSGNKRKITLSK